ncbi:MAG: hypothetical protein CBD27_00040 [Rhodospirillaceae bacterium TMED167]|nr:lytic murein transglycosylase [Rhodospirillaceae bacterium]OUW31621.1 MAG: hypothetical protein CBD27_00040 [Rhodospirillaceae bacterium TMED167]
MTRTSVLRFAAAVFLAVTVLALQDTAAGASGELSERDKIAAEKALIASKNANWAVFRKHQKAIRNPVLKKALSWHLFSAANSGASFHEIARFLRENGHWPNRRRLQIRAEEVMPHGLPASDIFTWFENRVPLTPNGTARLAASHLKQSDTAKATKLIREIWVHGNFGAQQERQFYRQFRRYMTREDHIERLDRLLWAGKYYPVRRMYRRIHKDYRALAEARLALRRFRGGVDRAISRVPDRLKNDPGLMYERLRWRRKKGKNEFARELLAESPKDLGVPSRWWRERAIVARRALRAGHVSEAYALAKNHGLGKEFRSGLISAEWLAGWIALRFLKDIDDKEAAYTHFVTAYRHATYPISRSRGAYWAGRAAESGGDTRKAHTWFRRAFFHQTTYYGQLAAARLPPGERLELPSLPGFNQDKVTVFDKNELVSVVRILGEAGFQDLLRPFIRQLNRQDGAITWRAKVARLASEVGRPDLAIGAAKETLRAGFHLIEAGYPLLRQKLRPGIEAPLVHAIIRQESAFNLRAISHAGARGLMQLMPGTASRVAKKNRLRYVRKKLTEDKAYNLEIGQAYVAELLREFDNSYILTLAAYNAGPGRVRRWIKVNGDPRDPMVDPIDWIELIPFDETRNYVQRVVANLHVYRHRMAETEIAFTPESDLRR